MTSAAVHPFYDLDSEDCCSQDRSDIEPRPIELQRLHAPTQEEQSRWADPHGANRAPVTSPSRDLSDRSLITVAVALTTSRSNPRAGGRSQHRRLCARIHRKKTRRFPIDSNPQVPDRPNSRATP